MSRFRTDRGSISLIAVDWSGRQACAVEQGHIALAVDLQPGRAVAMDHAAVHRKMPAFQQRCGAVSGALHQ